MDGTTESVAPDEDTTTIPTKTAFIFLRAGILVRNFVNPVLIRSLETSGYRCTILYCPAAVHYDPRNFALRGVSPRPL
ncbi:hypothetical protein OAJ57_05305 [Alphaproteobacteria bacterium]|nr:hypothetical protein [Alphaproteobacteria bacterium]